MISNDNIEYFINTNDVVIVKFTADWCYACRAFANINELCPTIIIDYDLNPDIAEHYSVTKLPTLLFYKNSELVKRTIGASHNVKEIVESLRS